MASRCGCGSGSGSSGCQCLIQAGEGIVVSGSGSVLNPYVVSSLCYAPRMTRLEALALQGANDLVVGCPIVVTDGPTIGDPSTGITSPTEILLWPTSDQTLGMLAEINTNFDNYAWAGRYDLGTGRIVELSDNAGNRVVDSPSSTGMLETQFPWGLGNCFFNIVDGGQGNVTLTGWGAALLASCDIAANVVGIGSDGASVDLSGMVGGGATAFVGNTVLGSVVDISAAQPSGTIVEGNEVIQDGTLIVSAGGEIAKSRIALGATLTTGAFSHSRVIIEGGFTQTLTGANSDTGRNFLGSNLI